MADLIKKIKIKKQDGTFTDYIPIGAEAQNVTTDDGDSVQLKLNKKPTYYNNVADMKSDGKLKVGDVAITLGYYNINDGGNGEYKIVSGDYTDDGGDYHQLTNGLFANLIVINDTVNIKQYGAIPTASTTSTPTFNSTTCIQTALDNHNNVVVPEGRFYAGQLFFNANGKHLRGVNRHTSELYCYRHYINNHEYLINIPADVKNFTIEDLKMIGSGVLNSCDIGVIKIEDATDWSADSTLRSIIRNCIITAVSGTALYQGEFRNGIEMSDCNIWSIQNGLDIRGTDNRITNISIGAIYRTGVYLGGGDSYMGNCKIWWADQKNHATTEKHYGLYLTKNHICENMVLQQNSGGSVFIEGSCNKLSFHADMVGDTQSGEERREDIAIVTFGENANHNMVEVVANQGQSGGHFDYICYFPESSTVVNNQVNAIIWNWYNSYIMKIRNDVKLHPSNKITVDNRDASDHWGTLITDDTPLDINWSWKRKQGEILPNQKNEYYYDCPVNISTVNNRTDGCFFSYDFTNQSNIKTIFISFDTVGTNIERVYDHHLAWTAIAIEKGGVVHKLYPSSEQVQIYNEWLFNAVINNPENYDLQQIRFGLFPHPNTSFVFPVSTETYPDHTEIRIANVKLKIIYTDGSEDIIESI